MQHKTRIIVNKTTDKVDGLVFSNKVIKPLHLMMLLLLSGGADLGLIRASCVFSAALLNCQGTHFSPIQLQ